MTGQSAFEELFVNLLELEAFATAEEGTVFEHGEGVGVQRPVGALARSVGATRDFDEAVVEGEVVAEGVLPALCVFPVETNSQ